jgi:hypothetical protein
MEKFKPLIKDLIKFYYNDLGNATGGHYRSRLCDGGVSRHIFSTYN